MDSLVFLSGLSETEAILGADQKLVDDTVRAAKELNPAFIALAGSPIPMMTGVDFPAVARQIEQETGIPSFGFPTDGMHSYIAGASMAFEAVAQRLVDEPENVKTTENRTISANILGVTPLDFSINGTDRAMKKALEAHGIRVQSVWAMGSSPEEIRKSGEADVNLVVSACGLKAAKVLKARFGTPYVVGTPCGTAFTEKLIDALKRAADSKENEIVCTPCKDKRMVIIGESVTALSLANALEAETKMGALVLCAVDTEPEMLSEGCTLAWDEDDLIPYLKQASCVIADPLYRPICPETVRFIPLPHEAFSGRIYREQIPELVTGFKEFYLQILQGETEK
jgi:nitrogenase molybdenum-iron protein alpha/beta subunit